MNTSGVTMEESKSEIRATALKRRAAADPVACRGWSLTIQYKTIEHPAYASAGRAAVYRAIGNEVGTSIIIHDALRQRKRVYVPGPLGTPRGFVQIAKENCAAHRNSAPLVSASELATAGSDGLVVIVPGVLFDVRGNRLGRGGGWYDRVLHALTGAGVSIGLAYEFQIVSQVPAESWDQRVHFLITEARVVDSGLQRLFRTAH